MDIYCGAWRHVKYPPLFTFTSVKNCHTVLGQVVLMTTCRYPLDVLHLQFNLGSRKIVSFVPENESGDNQGLDPNPKVTNFSMEYDYSIIRLTNFCL